jgi:hypothetical protein
LDVFPSGWQWWGKDLSKEEDLIGIPFPGEFLFGVVLPFNFIPVLEDLGGRIISVSIGEKERDPGG